MEPTCNVSSPVDAPARLSYAQKRDLLGHAVAAVITTALIAAPLITPPDDGAGPPLAALPAASFAAPVAAIAVADVTASSLMREIGRTPDSRQRTRPARDDSTAVAPATAAVQVSEKPVGTSGRETPRKPLSRRLTGWLTGNGAHTVRPFPSVSPGRP